VDTTPVLLLKNSRHKLLSLISFFSKRKSKDELLLVRFIEQRFHYRPKNTSLFIQAITHKSLSNNSENESSNERLEFLGDSILDAVVAEYVFSRFPNDDEGYLTKIKSKLVSRKTLSLIAEEMELREIIRYQKGRTINLNTLEGNAFEAIIGAMYLDSGFQKVKRCINDHVFTTYIDLNKILEEEIDFKSKLFIWSQKKQFKLEFVVVSEENIGGAWQYTILTTVNGINYGRGIGSSKKMAEQAASKETLELIGEL
jgi:ribonuclease III